MKDLTAFQRDTLRLIGNNDEPIGLEIKRALEDYYGKEVNHGRLYPNLDTLVNEGFVNKEELDGRTNTYTLTEKGRDALRTRDEWNKATAPGDTPKNLKRTA